VYFIPVVVFLAWSLYGLVTLPSLRDPAIVREPTRQLWSPARFLDDSAWTERGRRTRWQMVRHWLLGLVFALASFALVAYFGARR
jgi:hypothetical protein